MHISVEKYQVKWAIIPDFCCWQVLIRKGIGYIKGLKIGMLFSLKGNSSAYHFGAEAWWEMEDIDALAEDCGNFSLLAIVFSYL